jgi:undecaprenyl phosphate N,N'-diacetylbacillosamine 1-phosphate transferase
MLYPRFFKRPLDVLFASLALLLAFPFFVCTWILLSIQNADSAFFLQERPGKGKRPFKIIKFKTMSDEKDKHGNLLPDVKRITSVGAVVRQMSLDELPQLLNVLKGEMSLVGPRPLLNKYLPLYSPEQDRRHEVRPGITGWAQVNGRNSISWTEKFAYDLYYVENISFWLDLKILAMTALKVVRRQGINQSNERPMQPFNGSN